jgi:hypothetical protein
MASFVNTEEGIWKLILKKHTHTHYYDSCSENNNYQQASKQTPLPKTKQKREREREMGKEEEMMEFGNRRRTWYKIMGR